jgi:hypothetical protein
MAKRVCSVFRSSLLFMLTFGFIAWAQAPITHPPIIDMHLHAYKVADFGVGLGATPSICSNNEGKTFYGWDPRTPLNVGNQATCAGEKLPAPDTDEKLMNQTLARLERYNIRAVTSGDSGSLQEVEKWQNASPQRIISAVDFLNPSQNNKGAPMFRPIAELRRLVIDGKVSVFAEVAPQYDGMSPADPRLEPYFALAEELDVPVGIHMGEGPPGGPNVEGYSKYRVGMGHPLLLEDVLIRHPKLRIYVMHFGSPFVDEMIALLFSYPQVYVDVAGNDWVSPRKQFHSQLRRLVDAGFEKRIMFGSDQMIWPQAIDLSIQTIESADFLTEEQKRDILYNNAVRFLRLEDKTNAAPSNSK